MNKTWNQLKRENEELLDALKRLMRATGELVPLPRPGKGWKELSYALEQAKDVIKKVEGK